MRKQLFYKVILIEIDPIERRISDERNFGSREEARAWARKIDPDGYRAKIFQLPRDCFHVA